MGEPARAPSPSTGPLVLIVSEQVEPGGKLSHVDSLRAGLEQSGWRAEVYGRGRWSWLDRAWVAGPARALDLLQPALGHRWLVPAANQVFSRRLSPLADPARGTRLVHLQDPILFSGTRRAARALPVAVTVHGPVHREVASARGLALTHPTIVWLREIEARAYREAEGVIAVDTAHREYVRSLGRRGPTWVIPNFVDIRRFHPNVSPERFPDAVERWLEGRRVVLCPRRLVPKNGVATAIRAMPRLATTGAPCALLVVGDGPQRRELESLAREVKAADHVAFLGSAAHERMPGWCRRADVVVVPSVPSQGVEEATSISVLEAQACARPVVASALGGLREIVENERTGLLVPPGDVEALAAAIRRLLEDADLARTLGDAAAAHVLEHHSHVAGARRYIEVYRALNVLDERVITR